MSAATPRTVSTAPDLRNLGIALGALILAVALVVAVTVARQASIPSEPQAGASVPTTHDHGWSTAAGGATGLVIAGSNGGGLQYTGIPYANGTITISGTYAGGLQYTGIPYPAPDDTVGGGRGTRIAR